MAIRIRDNQNLASNPVTNFAGATSFTWMLRILVNQVTGNSEYRFMGGASYQMFSLRFAGSSGDSTVPISVGTTRSSGHFNMYPVNIPRGRVCHLACTYDGANLRLLLNGIQVGIVTAASAPVSGSGAISLGVGGSTGQTRDYIVDNFRVWRNEIISDADVKRDRDGMGFEGDYGTPFLDWSCAGSPAGSGVTAGAAGVSSPGVSTITVTNPAPTWSAADLSFVAFARIRDARVGPSRKTLILRLEDTFSGALTGASALVVPPSLTVDGVAVTIAGSGASGPIWQANSAREIVYPLPAPVRNDADVQLSVPAGWAQAGTLGDVQAESGMAVEVVDTLLQPLPESVEMGVGWNLGETAPWSTLILYGDLLKRCQNSFGTTPDPGGGTVSVTYDSATRFPARVVGGTASAHLIPYGFAAHDTRGYPNLPNGDYTLIWDGTGDIAVVQARPGHTWAVVEADLAGPTGKRRVYRLTLSTNPAHGRGVELWLNVRGQVANPRFLAPGMPADGSRKFHPGYLRMLEGSRCLRFMDATGTNTSNQARHEDLARSVHFTHGAPIHTRWFQVASIGPHDNSNQFFLPDGRAYLLITTAAPHGLTSGQCVRIDNLAGGPAGNGRVRLTNGANLDLLAPTQFVPSVCLVTSPTTFAIALGAPAQPDGVQAITGNGRVIIGSGMPFADCVEMSNEVGADPWICVPHAFTDEACSALAAELAPILGPGRKLYVEYTNEHWNFAPQFQQSYYNHGMAARAGLSDSAGYSKRAGEVHAIFAEAFAAAGRPGDLVRLFGGFAGNSAVTNAMVGYCAANGVPIDAVAIAPYFTTNPVAFGDRWLNLDMDQLHDLSDLAMLRHRGFVSGQKALLAAHYPGAKVICYEGGLELGMPSLDYGGAEKQKLASARSREWSLHPRARALALQYCLNLEQEGCDLFLYYRLAGGYGTHALLENGAVWAAYLRTDQPAGLGDGSDGEFDNRTALSDVSRVVSVVGGAVREWQSRSQEEAGGAVEGPGIPSSTKRISPGQLRRARASSRPRPRFGR